MALGLISCDTNFSVLWVVLAASIGIALWDNVWVYVFRPDDQSRSKPERRKGIAQMIFLDSFHSCFFIFYFLMGREKVYVKQIYFQIAMCFKKGCIFMCE